MGIFDKKQDGAQTITPDGADGLSAPVLPVVAVDSPTANISDSPTDTKTSDSETDTPTTTDTTSTAPTMGETENPEPPATKVEAAVLSDSPIDTTDDSTSDIETPQLPNELISNNTPDEVSAIESVSNPTLAPAVDIRPASMDMSMTSIATPSDNLSDIKREAIEQLSPLVELLDQTAEEKFHTTMMLLQSTDNKDLIKKAYDTAQQISDDKVKAQALLDVVNEINYYTQPPTE